MGGCGPHLQAGSSLSMIFFNDFPEFLAPAYLALKLLLKSKAIAWINTSRQDKGCALEPLKTGGHSPKHRRRKAAGRSVSWSPSLTLTHKAKPLGSSRSAQRPSSCHVTLFDPKPNSCRPNRGMCVSSPETTVSGYHLRSCIDLVRFRVKRALHPKEKLLFRVSTGG